MRNFSTIRQPVCIDWATVHDRRMIELVVVKFEGVIARVVPSLVEYFRTLAGCPDLDLVAVAQGWYASQRPWDSYLAPLLAQQGVPEAKILGIVARSERALAQVEAWALYPDVPLALGWMVDRRVPVTVVLDWPVDYAKVQQLAGVRANATAHVRQGPLSDVLWQETSRLGISASEVLYVAADLESDYEAARSLGCRALVMDRARRFDESVPGISHLIELELYIR